MAKKETQRRPAATVRRKSGDTVTIHDVAAEAGVSMKTVSRVLNKEPHVRAVLQDRVMAAVEKLDFRLNASARALRGARAYLIGLYSNNPVPGYMSRVQLGATEACRKLGCHLLVEQQVGDEIQFAEHLRSVQNDLRLDGVILCPPLCDSPAVIALLVASKIPYVRIAPAFSDEAEQAPRVFMDDRKAAYDMTVHLQSLGHRQIAFIVGPASHVAASRRRDGFMAAMADAGLDIPAKWLLTGDFSFKCGMELGEQLIIADDRPTAIFAANDDMALGVLAAAHRYRIAVPEALSIVGFDDSPSAQVVWPQLTTVRQPVVEMASAAVEMLMGMRNAKSPATSEQLGYALIERQSSGGAPNQGSLPAS